LADYSGLIGKFKTDDIPKGEDYEELITLAGNAKDEADNSVVDNHDGTITVNEKKYKPVEDNKDGNITVNGTKYKPVEDNEDNTITVNGKTFAPVIDNQNGTITVNTQTYTPADYNTVNTEFTQRGVNVKWFGAKGDGVADDSDAIQAAVDTGSSVFVPAGTYLITKTISLKLQNFIGAGTNQTFFNVQNADLFELSTGGRTIAEIANFRVESIGANANSNSVFKSKEDSTERAVTYHFHDIEINGGYFLYGFNLTDSFRITINKIGMTSVFNPFLLRGQVVQTTIEDVTCNIDTVEIGALNNYNTGIEVVGDSHSGRYQRPESVRLSNVNFVGYDLGYNIKDVLYFVSDKFECDYCANGIRTFSTDGGVTFTNGWIAVQNRRDTPSVGIDVLTSVANVLKPVSLTNINITGLSGIDTSSVGLRVGYDESQSSWFRKGVKISDIFIKNTDNLFKYAVQLNRAKNISLSRINVMDSTAKTDFYIINCESYIIENCYGNIASITNGTKVDSIVKDNSIAKIVFTDNWPSYYSNNGNLSSYGQPLVPDNKDGTEQLNGVQIQPFNKLSDSVGGRNLLPVSNYSSGYVSGTDGSISTADGTVKEVVSAFVPVDITQSYYCQIIQQVNNNTAWYGIGFYDSNKQFKSRFASGNTTVTGTITSVIRMLPYGAPNISIQNVSTVVFPANTAYIRISFRTYGNPIQSSLEKSSVLSDWTPAPEDKADDAKVVHLSTGYTSNRPTGVNLQPFFPSDLFSVLLCTTILSWQGRGAERS